MQTPPIPRPREFLLIPLLLILSTCPATAQPQVSKRVVASGGSAMDSNSYGVSATIGQLGTGTSASPSFAASAGFWFLGNMTATGIHDGPQVPQIFTLGQNYPNPFNPRTTIPFTLPRQSFVRLRVFDAAGRLVDDLVDEIRPIGAYEEPFVAASLASGIYYYRLETDGLIKTRRLVLVK